MAAIVTLNRREPLAGLIASLIDLETQRRDLQQAARDAAPDLATNRAAIVATLAQLLAALEGDNSEAA